MLCSSTSFSISSLSSSDYYNLSKIYVEKLPLIIPSKSDQMPLIELANKMLDLNEILWDCNTPTERKLLQQQIDYLDQKINQLVYRLYNLTEDEIKIIEDNV